MLYYLLVPLREVMTLVSNETILKKMQEEIQSAINSINDDATMKNHLSKIELLCELILQGNEKVELRGQNTPIISHNEINEYNKKSNPSIAKQIEDDGDGTSIFDF